MATAKFLPQRLLLFWTHLLPHPLAKFVRVAVDVIRIGRTAVDVRETGHQAVIVGLRPVVIAGPRPLGIVAQTGIVVAAVAVAAVDVAGVCRIRSMPLVRLEVVKLLMPLR